MSTATLEPNSTTDTLDMAASIAEAAEQPRVGIMELPVASIEPWDLNPRKTFDEDSLHALADSIMTDGVLQNIVVRCTDRDRQFGDTYQIVAGERRWRAAKLAGLTTIPARILPDDVSDARAFRLTMKENIERNSLAPLEEAAGYQQMLTLEPNLKQEDLAERLSSSQSNISNTLRLLRLPEPVRGLLSSGAISKAVGIALCALLDHPERCTDLARKAADEEWPQSRTQTEVRKKLDEIQAVLNSQQMNLPLADSSEQQARQAEREAAAALNTTDDFTAIPPPGTVETPPAAPADPAPPTEPEAPGTPAEPAPIEEATETVAEAPTPPQASAPPIVPSTPIAKPAEDAATVVAPGPRIAASISQADEEWLWEQNITLDAALAELRTYHLTPRAKEALGTFTTTWNRNHPDAAAMSLAQMLEMIVVTRAQLADKE